MFEADLGTGRLDGCLGFTGVSLEVVVVPVGARCRFLLFVFLEVPLIPADPGGSEPVEVCPELFSLSSPSLAFESEGLLASVFSLALAFAAAAASAARPARERFGLK